MRQPPRLALALLRRFLPSAARDDVTGDLLEQYAHQERTSLWFWGQTFSLCWDYAMEARRKAARRREFRTWESVAHELRSALRPLARRPGFALGIATLLGLGLGANGAMFHWVETVLRRPLAYPGADRLVRVFHTREGSRESLSPPNYFDLREGQEVFQQLAAYWSPSLTLAGQGEPETLLGATVSHTFFDVLGVLPRHGRAFEAEEDRPGAPLVAIVAHGLWRRRFGSDPGLLGRDIRLDGRPAKVIGIAPEGFSFPAPGTEIWVPLRLPRERPDQGETPYRSFRILNVIGRLEPESALAAARAAVEGVSRRLASDYPDSNQGFELELASLQEVEVGPFREPLLVLWGSVFAVLLVLCANVGGLLLARAADREGEIALRRALGASRSRLVRELLAEGLGLALLGGSLGWLFAEAFVTAIRRASPAGIPAPPELGVDARFLVFGFSMLAVVLVLFLSAPALFALRRPEANALRPGRRVEGGGQAKLRRVLVVAEMALALALLICARLLLESFEALQRVERGVREESVLYTSLELPFIRYPESHRRARFFEELLAEVRGLPGVEWASISLGLPLDPRAEFFVTRSPYTVEGNPAPSSGLKPEAALHVVGPDFFETLGVAVLAGRGFDARDRPESGPVAIVNRSFAESAWPSQDPLGKWVRPELMLLPDGVEGARRVVGVVTDFRYYALHREAEPQMYVPHAQTPWPRMHLLVRSSSTPAALQGTLREMVGRRDAEIPVAPLQELSAVTDQVMAPPRMRATLLSGFATMASLLAAIGLYGLISFSVSRRTREIALRIALGARRGEVLSLVVREGLKLALAGAALGLAGALLAARGMSSLLFGVSELDPWSYGLMCLALLAVAAVSSYAPARRAARIDPAAALRAE